MLRRPVDKGCRISYQWSPSRKYIHLVLTTFAEFHARKIMHNMVLKWERYLNCPTSVRVAGAIFAVTALIAILAPTWLWTSRGAVRPLPALGAAGSILVGSLLVRFPDPLADGSDFFKVRRGPCLALCRRLFASSLNCHHYCHVTSLTSLQANE